MGKWCRSVSNNNNIIVISIFQHSLANIVGQQRPNITTSGDGITSGNIQSNPAQQSIPHNIMDGKEGSGHIYIAQYNYQAQVQEDLTIEKGMYAT